jgi:hypothetical protein
MESPPFERKGGLLLYAPLLAANVQSDQIKKLL